MSEKVNLSFNEYINEKFITIVYYIIFYYNIMDQITKNVENSYMKDNNNKQEKQINIQMSGLRTREQKMYSLLLFSYIFYGGFGYIFHRFFATSENIMISVIMIIIFPILINTYSVFWHINFQRQRTPKEFLDELEKEIESEEASKVIPVILFGLGIFLTRLKNKNVLKQIIPYLIFSLLFGTVITEFVKQLIFDYNDLDRLIVAEEISFMFITLSFSLMCMSIYLTLKNLNDL